LYDKPVELADMQDGM